MNIDGQTISLVHISAPVIYLHVRSLSINNAFPFHGKMYIRFCLKPSRIILALRLGHTANEHDDPS